MFCVTPQRHLTMMMATMKYRNIEIKKYVYKKVYYIVVLIYIYIYTKMTIN